MFFINPIWVSSKTTFLQQLFTTTFLNLDIILFATFLHFTNAMKKLQQQIIIAYLYPTILLHHACIYL